MTYNPKLYDKTSMQYYKLKLTKSILNGKKLVNKNGEHLKFTVEEVYFDKGANIVWDTIIAYKEKENSNLSSYQFLYPNEQEEIVSADDFTTLLNIIEKICEERGLIQTNTKMR